MVKSCIPYTMDMVETYQSQKYFSHINKIILSIFSLLILTTGCHQSYANVPGTQRPYVINHKKYYPIPSSHGFRQKGIASWYGSDFHGKKTSNGETYDMYAPTAAHKVLPMNTLLLVRNLENGKETTVRVNDRGPFVYGRIIDLSLTAARQLGIVVNGTAKVEIIALGQKHTTPQGRTEIIAEQDFDKGEFYVQIGAFTNQKNALHLQRRFKEAGHTAVIQEYYTPEQLFYRVQVYVGQTLSGATKAEKALHQAGYKGAFVIAR